MLLGCDLSHYQDDATFEYCKKNYDFIILKATEGKKFVDNTFRLRASELQGIDIRKGYYHFARPDLNSYKEEADHFVETVIEYPNALYILDWEAKALSYPFQWAIDFCKYVDAITGITPIIYASASFIKKNSDLYGLWWTAHYKDACKMGCTHDNVDEVMTQYTSKPYDLDTFHGTYDQWDILTGKNVERDILVSEWNDGKYHYTLKKKVIK